MEALVNYAASWDGSSVSIFIGLALIYWQLLKANERLDDLKKDSTSDSANDPSESTGNMAK